MVNTASASDNSKSAQPAANFLGSATQQKTANTAGVTQVESKIAPSKSTAKGNTANSTGGANLKESYGGIGDVIEQLSSSTKFRRKMLVWNIEKKIKAGDTPGILKLLSNNTEAIFSASAAEIEQAKLKLLKKIPTKGLTDIIKAAGGTLLYDLMDQEIHFKDDD